MEGEPDMSQMRIKCEQQPAINPGFVGDWKALPALQPERFRRASV